MSNTAEGKGHRFLQIHPNDNVLVALQNLSKGEEIISVGQTFQLSTDISSKHKFTLEALSPNDKIYMYGVLVGRASKFIAQGESLRLDNMHHDTNDFVLSERKLDWQKPDVSEFAGHTFDGFHRADGSVGTSNYWLVIPLVFCENRNVTVLKEALDEKLGYKKAKSYENEVESLKQRMKSFMLIFNQLPKG
jgi:altronate hydrolase